MSDMRTRLTEELYKLGPSQKQIAKKIRCDPQRISCWMTGGALPSAYFLSRLLECGCDVIYILSGKKSDGGK